MTNKCFTIALFFCLSSRAHNSDGEMPSHLMIRGKRQKKDASSIEEELLSYRLLVSGGVEEEISTFLKKKADFFFFFNFMLIQLCSTFLPETIETFG